MGISGKTGEPTFNGYAFRPRTRGEEVRASDRDADPRPAHGLARRGAGIAQGATDYALEYAKTRE